MFWSTATRNSPITAGHAPATSPRSFAAAWAACATPIRRRLTIASATAVMAIDAGVPR